ncbi:MAG: MBL fold metallo-hydrolase [Pseudomonadota bacterium]
MIKVHFLGVRGSTPCADTRYSQYGGHTSCILVEADGGVFIFDAGSGIVNASAIALQQPDRECHLFFSHVHLDHIMGFPFFAPLWFKDYTVNIRAGSLGAYGGIKDFFTRTLKEPLFPVPFTAFTGNAAGNIKCEDFVAGQTYMLGNVRIDTFPLNHPNGAVAYRLTHDGKSMCYVTDHEHGDGSNRDGLLEFIKGTDVFIYDSTFADDNFAKFKGWGHSTWQEALRLGDDAEVAKTVIFHHDPLNTDEKMTIIEEQVQEFSHRGVVSRQGMIIPIS